MWNFNLKKKKKKCIIKGREGKDEYYFKIAENFTDIFVKYLLNSIFC